MSTIDKSLKPDKIFHVSEDGAIKIFHPRPSPSRFDSINGNVVFGISSKLLHNYLLPRDCPRVTYYANAETSQRDKETFFHSPAEFVIAVEEEWFPIIQQTSLYCYEFDRDSFTLLDEPAGYYISYEKVRPVSVTRIENLLNEIVRRGNIELLVLPDLANLADRVVKSSLSFSLIRMRNALPREIG
jgi:hypothetical protein